MLKKLLVTAGSVASLIVVGSMLADAPAKQPVFILLYTQISDHTHFPLASERIQRLLPALQSYRDKYPKYRTSAVFQFSGTMAESLSGLEHQLPLVQQLKDSAKRGTVEFGYTGEPEPTYHHRPRPNFLAAKTPEERWAARADAAEHFLSDFKNPLNGDPFPGLAGGLKRTQEVFGEVAYISGIDTKIGGNSALINQLRKYNEHAVLLGLPTPNPEFGVHGYAPSAKGFSTAMSPVPGSSPDLYWEDGYLHSSEFSLGDIRSVSTEDGPEALQKAFDKLDRSHVRVIHLEYGSYKRYLRKRQDGSVIYDPLDWAYNHPDEPEMPGTLNAFVDRKAVDEGYAKDEAVLRWLLEDYFPANPGSRFVSAADLKQMAQTPVGSEFTAGDLTALAGDLKARFVETLTFPPNFAKVGDRYLTLADSFELLATALADASHGNPPEKVKLTGVYGPLVMPGGMGPVGQVTVRDVMAAAAELAPRLRDDSWKPVPANAVPWKVTLGKWELNPTQFLRLMAEAYLDPQPGKTLEIKQCNSFSLATQGAPRSWHVVDQGNIWTDRPALLSLR